MKRSLLGLGFAIGVLAAATAGAENANQRMVGKKGIGPATNDPGLSAPSIIAMRYWMSDAMAVDVGFGLSVDTKVPNAGLATQDETLLDFSFDVGLPFVLHGEENMIVYLRPGIQFVGTNDMDPVNPTAPPNTAVDKHYDLGFAPNVGLGGEFFLGQLGWPNLSFSGQVGVSLLIVSPGEEGAETDLNIATTQNDVSLVNTGSLGFKIYF